MEPPKAILEVLDQVATVGQAVVQESDDMPSEMQKDLVEELAYVRLPDVLKGQSPQEVQPPSDRTDCDASDDRDSVVAETVMDERGLTNGRPSLSDAGSEQKARFVDENQVGAQPRRVFFTRGHSLCFHSWTAVSLRSMALLSGF